MGDVKEGIDLRSAWEKQRDAALAGRDEDDGEDGDAPPDPNAPPSDEPPAKKRKLVKRVLMFSISCFDLESDDPDALLTGNIVSKVPGGPEFTKMAHYVARLANGVAWESIPLGDRKRFGYLAMCMYQIIDGPPWLLPRLEEDFDFLVVVCGRLAEHQGMFRLRGRSLEESKSSSGLPVGVAIGELAPLPAALQRRGA